MSGRLLDRKNGVETVFHYDAQGDTAVVEVRQDCERIIEHNKRLQGAGPHNIGDWGRLRARIPLALAHKWMVEDGVNWLALPKDERSAYLKRKLNDPQYRHLMVDGGKV